MMAAAIRVLYVDDESTLLELCKLYLERSGDFTVTITTSASEALRILDSNGAILITSFYGLVLK